MKRLTALLVFLVTVQAAPAAIADYDVSSVPAEVFRLKIGLSLGSAYDDFLYLLGKPEQMRQYYSRKHRVRVRNLRYHGLSARIVGDLINHITVTSRIYRLPNGVKVGDRKQQVFELLGRARLEAVKPNSQLARYYVRNPRNFFTEEYLLVYFKGNRVNKIVLWFPVLKR